MTLVLGVRNVCVRVLLMFWKWFLGMGVKLIRLRLLPVQKIV